MSNPSSTADRFRNWLLFSAYCLVVAIVFVFTVGLTVVAAFIIHSGIVSQFDSLSWAEPTAIGASLFGLGVIFAVGIGIVVVASRVLSGLFDYICAGVFDLPDGNYWVGVSGLVGVGFASMMWFAPYWNDHFPNAAATVYSFTPPGLPGDLATFAAAGLPISLVYIAHIFSVPVPDYQSDKTEVDGESTMTSNQFESDNLPIEESPTTETPKTSSYRDSGEHSPPGTTTDNTVSEETATSDYQADGSDEGRPVTESRPSHPESVYVTSESDAYANRDDKAQDGGGEPFLEADSFQFDWQTSTDVTMDDVGGMEELKESLHSHITEPMQVSPEKADRFDISTPNVLFHGPPGTGKTFIAKALASELGYPFVQLSGGEITSKWINESSDRVKELFDEAESIAATTGGAVIFLDELDAVLPKRQHDTHEEDRKVVNEFLAHLQESSAENVLFIGATNRRDDLDEAATRSGRIDKEIFIGEPDLSARKAIFEAQLQSRPANMSDDQLQELADITEGLVAADIKTIVDQAARKAVFEDEAESIEFIHLKQAARDLDCDSI